MESRVTNATRNIFSGLINKIITILVPFITRTIMIYYLGTQYLGLNSLFTSVLQILNLAELGFGNALVYSMYKPIAEKNEEKVRALLKYYKTAYRIIGIVILVLGIIILPFINYFITGGYPSDINIYYIYIIYLVNTVLSYLLYAYKSSLLIASQRNDITTNINTILMILQNVIQVLIIILMQNYYYYIIVIPIMTIINNLITAKICDKTYPQYMDGKNKSQLEEKEKANIKKNTKGMIYQKIGGVVLKSVDNIVISAFLGLNILGIYNNYYYIITALFGIVDIILNSLKSSVGNSIVLEAKEKNYEDFKKFNFLFIFIISWMTLALLFLAQDFIRIWLGERYLLSNFIVILFAIYFFINKWCDILYVYQEAKGLWWENRFVPLISATVNLIVNIILVKIIGLPGILISTIVSLLFITDIGYAKVLFSNYFNFKGELFKYIKEQIKYLIGIVIVAIISSLFYFIIDKVIYNVIIRFGVKIITTITVPTILLYIIFRNFEEYNDASKFLSSVILKLGKNNKIIGKIVSSVILFKKQEKQY